MVKQSLLSFWKPFVTVFNILLICILCFFFLASQFSVGPKKLKVLCSLSLSYFLWFKYKKLTWLLFGMLRDQEGMFTSVLSSCPGDKISKCTNKRGEFSFVGLGEGHFIDIILIGPSQQQPFRKENWDSEVLWFINLFIVKFLDNLHFPQWKRLSGISNTKSDKAWWFLLESSRTLIQKIGPPPWNFSETAMLNHQVSVCCFTD